MESVSAHSDKTRQQSLLEIDQLIADVAMKARLPKPFFLRNNEQWYNAYFCYQYILMPEYSGYLLTPSILITDALITAYHEGIVSSEELTWLISHEISHMKNGMTDLPITQMRTYFNLKTIAFTNVLYGLCILFNIATPLNLLFINIFLILLTAFFSYKSRNNELRADQESIILHENRQEMALHAISLLKKIEHHNRTNMYVIIDRLFPMFSAHPRLTTRIKWLRNI